MAPLDRLPKVVEALRRLGAKQILLFGSAAESPETARDIDLAVSGIPISKILDADVAVNDIFSFPTDLISREENPRFFEIIQKYGKMIYEQK